MIKPVYTYIEKNQNNSLNYLLSNFDTIFINISYISQLKNTLSELKDKNFDISFAKEKWKWDWAISCLKNHEEIAIQINCANKSVDTISYHHIISELSEPSFWSDTKIKKMKRIVVTKY